MKQSCCKRCVYFANFSLCLIELRISLLHLLHTKYWLCCVFTKTSLLSYPQPCMLHSMPWMMHLQVGSISLEQKIIGNVMFFLSRKSLSCVIWHTAYNICALLGTVSLMGPKEFQEKSLELKKLIFHINCFVRWD